MNGKKSSRGWAAALICLLLAAFLLFGMAGAEPDSAAFSCYTVDSRGLVVHGFQRADNEWYLFVPSTLPVSQVKLHYTGTVTASSAGELDLKHSLVSGGFAQSGDSLTLTLADGTEQQISVRQSSLPALQLTLDGETLDSLHADKNLRFRLDRFVLTEPGGVHDFTATDSAEIKGRGNTTWTLYDKKAYQIKFDAKVPILGMGKAKRWVLLANASDDSMIRTQLVYRLAKNMEMEFVPSYEYVDLWINGEYRGTYLLGEKVELDKMRLNLSHPIAALFEHDEAYYAEAEWWFLNQRLNRHFVIKEIATETEPAVEEATAAFNERLDQLITFLYSTPSEDVTLEALSGMIDVDSFAKYYLINEYTLNCESYATSFYWYQDGPEDVLHLGPIWDFDTCMGNDGRMYTESYGQQHVLFAYLLASPEFHARTQQLYELYRPQFAAMAEDATLLESRLASSAEMNYLRWDVLGESTHKLHAKEFHPTFAGAVEFVRHWLQNRQQHFTVEKTSMVSAVVSEDCRTMDIWFDDGQPHESALFAIESRQEEPLLSLWCDGELVDGKWHARVDMTKLNRAGLYHVFVHVDESDIAAASGRSYVETAVAPDYPMESEFVSEDEKLIVRMEDPQNACLAVSCAVWSEANNQSDLQWFDAVENEDGVWILTVDMSQFAARGKYVIHAYGNITGESYEYLNETIVKIP